MRPLRTVALAVVAIALLYGGYRLFVHVRAPVIPAVLTTTMDAHRALAMDPAARIDRFLHDRPPAPPGDARLIALTFDDGPYPVETPLLLDVLAEQRVPATFFLIGRDAEEYPELTRRIHDAGHEIADHTLTHPDLDEMGDGAVKAELDDGAAMLERFVRDPAIRTMMRPPHGRFTEATIRVAQRDGYATILWNDDPGDWRSLPAQEIAAHVEAHATAPDIVLLHSGRLATVEALPGFVARFRAAGFTFVTVGELLRRLPVPTIDHPVRHTV